MTKMLTPLRRAALNTVTEAYDLADEARRETERYAPDVAGMVKTACDLLFSARMRLSDES